METPIYLGINLGRNIGDAPMPSEAWARFCDDARDALNVATYARQGTTLASGMMSGTGEWARVVEDSAHIWALVTAYDAAWLRDRLSVLASTYRQDALALIVGASDLITPNN